MGCFRARLHQALASTLLQLYDNASDTVLIENNGVVPEWGCNPFRVTLVFNENSITSVIQSSGSVDADAWCKRALT